MRRDAVPDRPSPLLPALLVALACGCSSGEEVPPTPIDGAPPLDAAGIDRGLEAGGPLPDAGPATDGPARADGGEDQGPGDQGPGDASADGGSGDGDGSIVDGGSGDGGCILGTADHCAACGDECPGPKSSPSTVRVCIGGSCDIQCEEEYYDVDGLVDNGCEATDDLPVHDSLSIAAEMGIFSDCSTAKSESAVIPSDDRKHLKSPTDRPNGRVDYFTLGIDDDWCTINATINVSLAGLPPAAKYQLEAAYRCGDSKTLLAPVSKSAAGGQVTTLEPDTGCTTLGWGDDSGTVILTVTKLSGPHSDASYQVSITP